MATRLPLEHLHDQLRLTLVDHHPACLGLCELAEVEILESKFILRVSEIQAL